MVQATSNVYTRARTTYIVLDATDDDVTHVVAAATAIEPHVAVEFYRADSSGNTVTITDNDALTITLDTAGDSCSIVSDGTTYRSRTASSTDASAVAADLATHLADTTTHGTTGDIVGTTDTQTLSNKTMTSPIISTVLAPSGATKTSLTAEPVDPVNYFAETISATGDPVYRQAAGTDSNIAIGMYGKGTGAALLGPSVSEGPLPSTLPGSAGNLHRLIKKVTAITDNTFTDILTVTVPNAAHSAGIRCFVVGALGDADSSACDQYMVVCSRQSAENTVLEGDVIVTAIAQPSATGAETIAMTFQLSGLTGASGATQTFTIQAKIAKGGGSSSNHYLTAEFECLNQNTGGVTIA